MFHKRLTGDKKTGEDEISYKKRHDQKFSSPGCRHLQKLEKENERKAIKINRKEGGKDESKYTNDDDSKNEFNNDDEDDGNKHDVDDQTIASTMKMMMIVERVCLLVNTKYKTGSEMSSHEECKVWTESPPM